MTTTRTRRAISAFGNIPKNGKVQIPCSNGAKFLVKKTGQEEFTFIYCDKNGEPESVFQTNIDTITYALVQGNY